MVEPVDLDRRINDAILLPLTRGKRRPRTSLHVLQYRLEIAVLRMRSKERRGDKVFSTWMTGACDQREMLGQIRVCDLAGHRTAGIVRTPIPLGSAPLHRINVSAERALIGPGLAGKAVVV